MNTNDLYEAAMASATNAQIREAIHEIAPEAAMQTVSLLLPCLIVALLFLKWGRAK